jgi:hypothetical protein
MLSESPLGSSGSAVKVPAMLALLRPSAERSRRRTRRGWPAYRGQMAARVPDIRGARVGEEIAVRVPRRFCLIAGIVTDEAICHL